MTPLAAARIALVLTLAGCALEAPAPAGAPAPACPVAGTAPMTMVRLYFGRGGVGADAWAAFRARAIAAAFPDGFTELAASGRDAQTAAGDPSTRAPSARAQEDGEATTVIEAAVPRGADIAAKVAAVAEPYKARFHQRAVGVAMWDVCGGF